ncbi:aldo/keto reductase [Arthrobacter sp. RIT-PI-e]|uniref:aldo/keto reductase n=1 Tax=Arthrobacter sp. RIT-PI-e TaxID=1681197 RepID=UPI0006766A4A|nr:aldo/keto reductase [Arthrobacter sp. RIT-PI-e]KNC20211.1 aldo/keto reductase [Arthrobacter sp. RIT-PI-e]
MRGRVLAGTGISLTELGFGAAGLGNMFHPVSDEQAAETLTAAWECGVRYFDTAPHYGLGLSERRVGAALAEHHREDFVISTKVGRLLVPRRPATARDDDIFAVPGDLRREWDFSRDGVLRSIEASLERLGLDRLDIVHVHDPEVSGIPDAAVTAAAALVELRDEGVVGAVGIGSNDAGAVADLLRTTDIDTAMLAGRYTLLDRAASDAVFEAAAGRSIVAAAVFNSGLLSRARPPSGATYDYAPAPADLIERAGLLAAVVAAHGRTLPAAALAFPLRNTQVAAVVVGMRTPDEVRENADRVLRTWPDRMWRDLEHRQG